MTVGDFFRRCTNEPYVIILDNEKDIEYYNDLDENNCSMEKWRKIQYWDIVSFSYNKAEDDELIFYVYVE